MVAFPPALTPLALGSYDGSFNGLASILPLEDLIMAVPKRRTSHSRQGMRRSHLHRKPKQNAYCTRCGAAVLPHVVCYNCGWLNSQGREAIPMEAEKE